MGYAFISYCSKNKQQADALRELLKRNGIPVKMAPYDMRSGDFYAGDLKRVIAACACVVLLLTKDSASRDNVIRETELGVQRYKKPYVVLNTDGVDISQHHTMDFYLLGKHVDRVRCPDRYSLDPADPALQKAIKTIKQHTGTGVKKAQTPITADYKMCWHHILTKVVLFALALVFVRDAIVLFGGDHYNNSAFVYAVYPWLKGVDIAAGAAAILWAAALLLARHRVARYQKNSVRLLCGVCVGSALTQIVYMAFRHSLIPLAESAFAALFGGVAILLVGVILTALYYRKREQLFTFN